MRHIRLVLCTVLLVVGVVCWSAIGIAQVRSIVGGNVAIEAISPPSGVCSSSFTLSSEGVLNFVEQGANEELSLAPFENSFNGYGYFGVSNTAVTAHNIYRINLNTFVSDLTISTDVANTPDRSDSHGSSYYDTTNGTYVNTGRDVTTGACAISTTCLHVRTYELGSLASDVIVGGVEYASNSPFTATTDNTNVYIPYGAIATPALAKLDNSSFVLSAAVAVATTIFGVTNDTNYVYGLSGTTTIRRWLKSNIAAGSTDFTPGIVSAALRGITYDSGNDVIYVGARSAGLGPNIVYRIAASTMAITGSVSLGNEDFISDIAVDSTNDKIYVGYALSGTTGGITRINRSTLAIEGTFGTVGTANGPLRFRLDIPHQKYYIAFSGGGGDVSKIQKVNLCS